MPQIENPYMPTPRYRLRGNLHAHSTRSDGTRTPQVVIDDYAARGYDFLMLSDHDTVSDYAGLDARGMILIAGNEISSLHHVLHVNAKEPVPQNANLQTVADMIRQKGGHLIMNHPNWQGHFNHIPLDVLRSCQGCIGIEIVNGTVKHQEGSEFALDKWDMLLSEGRKLWGFGNDDAHGDHGSGLAWNEVWTDDCSQAGVLQALTSGSFYVSTGVQIADIRVVGDFIHVSTTNASKLIVSTVHGKRVAEAHGREIHYRLRDTDRGFLRVTAMGGPDEFAFTQPFMLQTRSGATGSRPVHCVPRLEIGHSLQDRRACAGADSAWQAVAALPRFGETESATRAIFSPLVKLALDGATLRIHVICLEPLLDELSVSHCMNGDSRIWSDDGVEIFIDPTNTRSGYYHLMVNAAGAWHIAARHAQAVSPAIEVMATRSDTGYVLDIAIPLADLPGALDSKIWAFNICRNKYTQPRECSQWVPTGGSYHCPSLFGELHF